MPTSYRAIARYRGREVARAQAADAQDAVRACRAAVPEVYRLATEDVEIEVDEVDEGPAG